MPNKLEIARKIAETADVSTPENSIVLYSISYLPSDANKRQAHAYLKANPSAMMLDDTVCGKELIALGLETGSGIPPAEIMQIWAIASKRFIMAASGDVRAFVQDADPRSTFVSVELPLILQNPNLKKINGIDKYIFASQWNIGTK
jgi:hypothetical protein